jgi:hypothetical protein
MRMLLSVLAQFLLFLATFLVGSLFLHPFHVQTTLASDGAHARFFQWDGVLLMALLFVLVLVLEASMKRLRAAALGSTIAVALAGVLGLAMKFGFVTVDR